MGGHSKAAFRRAVTHGDGWYGYALDVDATAACVEGLRTAAQRYERPGWLGELEITVTPELLGASPANHIHNVKLLADRFDAYLTGVRQSRAAVEQLRREHARPLAACVMRRGTRRARATCKAQAGSARARPTRPI